MKLRLFLKKIFLYIYQKQQILKWYKNFWINSYIQFSGKRIWNCENIYIGSNVSIWKRCSMLVSKEYNWEIYDPFLKLWNNFCCGNDLFISCIDSIIIGNDVLFSDRVFITDHIHDYKNINIPVVFQNLEKRWSVTIWDGSFVWINSVILPGVKIWKHCIIWASSVVIKDIPDYCVVTWNPAKIIKKYNLQDKKWEKI